ncbi:hypothetical protein GCK32_000557 [Trichostrongylus colubriformis]|uniref:Uncharacterized protein n=1 Tax=Trichostrongylus colubriformis TaxID=6319 RepID=A0AAN8IC60_TRICO
MSTTSSEEERGIKPIWFVIFELIYIVIFVAISVAIHLFGLIKTDEDAVTIHHRIHKEIIAQQERNYMSQKKENFLRR